MDINHYIKKHLFFIVAGIILVLVCVIGISIIGYSFMQKKEVKVATWNVKRCEYQMMRRHTELLKILIEKDCDIIALQEAGLDFYSLIDNDKFKKYQYTSYCEGLIVLSKYPIITQKCNFDISLQCRPILIVDILYNDKILRVIDVHLDSFKIYKNIRFKQIEYLKKQINCENVIVLGDFNINDADPENEKLDEILIDSWKALYFDDKGYTWNKEKNYLARVSSAWDDPNERIDRIFVNHAEWLDSMELLGTEPIDDNLWPSDHFGLLGVFKI